MQERILCSQGKASKDIAPQSREIVTDVCMVVVVGGGRIGVHELATHHTSVCEFQRFFAARSLLVVNKSLSNLASLLVLRRSC